MRILLALAVIAFGFVIYPYYVDYIITPVTDIAVAISPGMNVLEEAYINILPFGVLLLILYIGIMMVIGKGKADG